MVVYKDLQGEEISEAKGSSQDKAEQNPLSGIQRNLD